MPPSWPLASIEWKKGLSEMKNGLHSGDGTAGEIPKALIRWRSLLVLRILLPTVICPTHPLWPVARSAELKGLSLVESVETIVCCRLWNQRLLSCILNLAGETSVNRKGKTSRSWRRRRHLVPGEEEATMRQSLVLSTASAKANTCSVDVQMSKLTDNVVPTLSRTFTLS